jgi:hypothetical protein
MTTDSLHFGPELGRIRACRICLWLVALSYVPMMFMTFKWTHSDTALGAVFVIWLVFLCRAVLQVAFARCPRCGNYFHIKNFFPSYLQRSCVHCGLHINADKNSMKPPSAL